MVYYTTNTFNYPYTWSATSSGTSSTSYTYSPNFAYDCSGWATHVIKNLKRSGLDKEKITEDMIEELLKKGDN